MRTALTTLRRGPAGLMRPARRLVDLEPLWVVRCCHGAPEPSIDVREAGRGELDRLVELYSAGHRPLRSWWRRRLLSANFDRGHICLVIDDGTRLVGCAWLAATPFRLSHYGIVPRLDPAEAYLHGVHVRPGLRGRGYGESLVTAATRLAAGTPGRAVVAHISPRNPVTPHLFLEKLRYEVVGSVRVFVVFRRIGLPISASAARDDATEATLAP